MIPDPVSETEKLVTNDPDNNGNTEKPDTKGHDDNDIKQKLDTKKKKGALLPASPIASCLGTPIIMIVQRPYSLLTLP